MRRCTNDDRELELRGTRGNVGEDAGVAECASNAFVRVPCAQPRPGGIGIFLRVGLSRTAAATRRNQSAFFPGSRVKGVYS